MIKQERGHITSGPTSGGAHFLLHNQSKTHVPKRSHLLLCCFFGFWVHPAHTFEIVLKCPFNVCHHVFNLRDAEADSSLSCIHRLTHLAQLVCALTMALPSSAKVSLTNMAPTAKPKALSVSLTHSFQRGMQLCKTQEKQRPAEETRSLRLSHSGKLHQQQCCCLPQLSL